MAIEKMGKSEETPLEEEKPSHRKWAFKPAVVGAVVILFVFVVLVVIHHNLTKLEKKLVQRIKGKIPSVPYTSKISFYVIVKSKEGEETMIKLDVAFNFFSLDHKECFDRNEILFRDVSYRFLKDQIPERHTLKGWASIVTKNLPEHLRKELGLCKIDSIYLETMQRL